MTKQENKENLSMVIGRFLKKRNALTNEQVGALIAGSMSKRLEKSLQENPAFTGNTFYGDVKDSFDNLNTFAMYAAAERKRDSWEYNREATYLSLVYDENTEKEKKEEDRTPEEKTLFTQAQVYEKLVKKLSELVAEVRSQLPQSHAAGGLH